MFDIFFGWRKASKCKKLIKRVRCRLKLLKNKRFSIAKQLRDDMAQLIKHGYEDTAFNRAEQLVKDENIIAVYDLLDYFCEFVDIHLSYIRKHKDIPNDISEAISSLIFASARCADLPELLAIRKLFGERYGHRFATTAVELLPGNLVNREIHEKLSMKSVSDDVKYRLIDEIARDYRLQPENLALEYFPEWQRQASDGGKMEAKSIQVYPLAQMDPPFQSIVDASSDRQSRICTTNLKQRDDEMIKIPCSPERSPPFSKEVVVYLDEIEELQSSQRKEADCQDQRLFKFKSLSLPTRRVVVDGTDGDDESYTDSEDQDDDDEPSPNRNKSRRRSYSFERSSMKDVDHEIYYANGTHKSHHHGKVQKKKTLAESKESTYVVLKRPKQPCNFHGREETCSPRNQKPGQFQISVAEEISDEKSCKSSLPRLGTTGPYLRETTMPQGRPREIHRYSIVRRSNSLSIHNPNHVHPKLPEYEDIAAKFMALKKEKSAT